MTGAIRALGHAVIQMLYYLGQVAQLFVEVLRSLRVSDFRYKQLGRQLVAIGFGSQLVVIAEHDHVNEAAIRDALLGAVPA